MAVPRTNHSATRLRDGDVLVVGGSGDADAPGSAERYDAGTESWTATGQMTAARSFGHRATLLRDGTVLVTGGLALDDVNLVASAELYDPRAGTWTATSAMQTARILDTVTVLRDGRVLVVGGADNSVGGGALATAELYDPVKGTWAATRAMSKARVGHTATLLPDGTVLVAGGWDGSGEGGAPVGPPHFASAELYDPDTGTWTATGGMDRGRAKHAAVLLTDGSVLVSGGGALAAAEIFDPGKGDWTAVGSMVRSRQSHTATLLRDGTVLVTSPDRVAFAELFDPAGASWTAVPNPKPGRGGHSATLLRDGTVLVAGGSDFDGNELASAVAFVPGGVSP